MDRMNVDRDPDPGREPTATPDPERTDVDRGARVRHRPRCRIRPRRFRGLRLGRRRVGGHRGTRAGTASDREAAGARHGPGAGGTCCPSRGRRRFGIERLLVRLIATCGIVGIGVAIAAIMVSSNSKGWLVGVVVSVVSVALSGLLWSSRQL